MGYSTINPVFLDRARHPMDVNDIFDMLQNIIQALARRLETRSQLTVRSTKKYQLLRRLSGTNHYVFLHLRPSYRASCFSFCKAAPKRFH